MACTREPCSPGRSVTLVALLEICCDKRFVMDDGRDGFTIIEIISRGNEGGKIGGSFFLVVCKKVARCTVGY